MREYNPKSQSVKIRVDGRVVGEVRGDVFYKRLKPEHFLTKPPGIAFDVSSLDEAEGAGARRVHVTNLKTGAVYEADIAIVRAKGILFNRSFGWQIGLPFRYWRLNGNPPQCRDGAESQPEQLSLFA